MNLIKRILSGVIYIALIYPNISRKDQILPYEKRFIAHRGLFNNEDIPENTLKSFAKAVENDFGIELPDELESQLSELTVTEESLSGGNLLKDMHFPQGTLVMMVKRGNSFIVPNGQLELRSGDILLTIASQQAS